MNKSGLGRLINIIVLVISLFCVWNIDWIVPSGYNLAIDGIVISRALFLIFSLYCLLKLGYDFSADRGQRTEDRGTDSSVSEDDKIRLQNL